jgi:hypothetical protein
MRFQLLIVATMILASCATQQAPPSNEPKKSQASNRDRDLYECEREAAFASAGNKQQVFDKCMKARGYSPK